MSDNIKAPGGLVMFLLAGLTLLGAGCGSLAKKGSEKIESSPKGCEVFTADDGQSLSAEIRHAIARDASLNSIRAFASSTVTAFAAAPTLPGDYQWNGEEWSALSTGNERTLRFPGNWILKFNADGVSEKLTGPELTLTRNHWGNFDGADDWATADEMGEWRHRSWNCYTCGIPDNGESAQTPWANYERHDYPPFEEKLLIKLGAFSLEATFNEETGSAIEFNGSKQKFDDVEKDCPGLRKRIVSIFPDVSALLNYRR